MRNPTHLTTAAGWLKNPTEYYYGLRNNIQRAQVKNVLSSVMLELDFDANRKFIVVEMFFFDLWWSEQGDKMKALVHKLIASKQLEFIGGGHTMHDETDSSYAEMLDNTALGHRLLLQELNVTPSVAWAIDPWGHTSFQSTHISSPLAGMNSLFFGRIDWEEVQHRRATKSAETIWAPSPSLGLTAATFAGHLMNTYVRVCCTCAYACIRDFYRNCVEGSICHNRMIRKKIHSAIDTAYLHVCTDWHCCSYQPPSGFDMSEGSHDDPIVDYVGVDGYNVLDIVNKFVNAALAEAAVYRGNDVMMTFGSDFNYGE